MSIPREKSQIMSYYENMVSRQRKWMFYLLAAFMLGAGFTPYPHIFLGLFRWFCQFVQPMAAPAKN